MDFILLIMNCKKYEYKAKIQKQTWLRLLPENISYYHVIGDENLLEDFDFNDQERILYVKTPDDYCNLPKKVIASYKAAAETFGFKYILKTDDDQMLVNLNFFHNLTKMLLQQKFHYGGYNVVIKEKQFSKYNAIHPELPKNLLTYPTTYCNGRFYLLSNESVKDLIRKREPIRKEYFEDYAIGYYLDSDLKQMFLNIDNSKFFVDTDKIDNIGQVIYNFDKIIEEAAASLVTLK